MIDAAIRYDVDICDYIDNAWLETDVKNLVCYDKCGYTLVTLSVALWAYWHASSFEEGLLAVVNAGGDADLMPQSHVPFLEQSMDLTPFPKNM